MYKSENNRERKREMEREISSNKREKEKEVGRGRERLRLQNGSRLNANLKPKLICLGNELNLFLLLSYLFFLKCQKKFVDIPSQSKVLRFYPIYRHGTPIIVT